MLRPGDTDDDGRVKGVRVLGTGRKDRETAEDREGIRSDFLFSLWIDSPFSNSGPGPNAWSTVIHDQAHYIKGRSIFSQVRAVMYQQKSCCFKNKKIFVS